MPATSPKKSIHRIIDANFNRLKEGLRVCEEIARFTIESRALTARLKQARHKATSLLTGLPYARGLIRERRSLSDIGKNIYGRELKRKNYQDIFFANMQRVKESLRVLEEFTKISDTKTAVAFKRLRYSIYDIEKKIIGKMPSL